MAECTACGGAFVPSCTTHIYCNEPCRRRAQSRRCYAANPMASVLRTAKQRARKKGVEFDLTVADVEMPTHCPLLGLELERGGDRENSPALDRLDSSKGYTPDNVWIISYRANRIKNDATLAELEMIVEGLRGKDSTNGVMS